MLKTYQKRNLRIAIQLIFLIFAIIYLIYRPFYITKVVGSSMQPTLETNALVLANATDRNYKIGDVVLAEQNSELIIKRIAFVSGQKFPVVDLGVRRYQPLPNFKDPEIHMKYLRDHGIDSYMFIVPEGHVFLVGDNETESEDSRTFGSIPVKNIRAKIIEL